MIKSLEDVVDFLNLFRGNEGNIRAFNTFKRMRLVLNELDKPQEKFQIIHVAGTSGKTSTSIYSSYLLASQGLKVGLTYSPYLVDFRERFQINNKFIEEEALVRYINHLKDVLLRFKSTKFGYLSRIEVCTIIALYIFAMEKVDVAVLEVGVGGLYDSTNIEVDTQKICLLNSIGYDHKKLLGDSISEIAFQKCGIIQAYSEVISINQPYKIRKIFQRQADQNHANLTFLKDLKYGLENGLFYFEDENFSINNISIASKGDFQVQNIALAISGVIHYYKLLNQDYKIDLDKIKNVISCIQIPGRFQEINYDGLDIIVDGAHNPQKMEFFLKSFKDYYPNSKTLFVTAFKEGKEYKKILNQISMVADTIVLTEFNRNQYVKSTSVVDLEICLAKLKYPNYSILSENISLNKIKSLARGYDKVVITGSLYLVGEFLQKYYQINGKT